MVNAAAGPARSPATAAPDAALRGEPRPRNEHFDRLLRDKSHNAEDERPPPIDPLVPAAAAFRLPLTLPAADADPGGAPPAGDVAGWAPPAAEAAAWALAAPVPVQAATPTAAAPPAPACADSAAATPVAKLLMNPGAATGIAALRGEPAAVWEISLNDPRGMVCALRAERPAGLHAAGTPAPWTLTITAPALDAAALLRHAPRLNERLKARALAPAHLRIDGGDERG